MIPRVDRCQTEKAPIWTKVGAKVDGGLTSDVIHDRSFCSNYRLYQKTEAVLYNPIWYIITYNNNNNNNNTWTYLDLCLCATAVRLGSSSDMHLHFLLSRDV